MPEETDIIEDEETTDDIWKKLGIKDPEEEFEAESEEAEGGAGKEDKILKKLSAQVENFDKKFTQDRLQREKERFLESADTDALEKDLFKTVNKFVTDPESLQHAITLTKRLAAEQREKIAAYDKGAKEQVSKAWGGASPGQASQSGEDDEEKRIRALEEAGRKGDAHASFLLWHHMKGSGEVTQPD